jgi:hypothetical protein
MGSGGAEDRPGTAVFHLPDILTRRSHYSEEPPTLVEFKLEEPANGTLLLLTESGFDKIPAGRRLEAFPRNDGGWTEQMKNIETYVV